MRWLIPLFGMLLCSAVSAQPMGEGDFAADEAVLRAQKLPTKGAELLQILRDRTPSAETVKRFKSNAARLNATAYGERVKATGGLLEMGPVVRPLLENVLHETKPDAETAGRIRHVLEHFPVDKDDAAISSAARLLQRDKPAGSLSVLLDFVPHATTECVRQEVQRAINAVALVDKKPAPLVIDALTDANFARRAAAGEALVRIGDASMKEKISPLLNDAHPLVRYQVSIALVEKHDKSALPVLIAVLADSPAERVECALELLYRAAGESAPAEQYHGKQSLGAVTTAWQKWYEKHQTKLDLSTQFARGEAGFTIIGCMVPRAGAKGKLYEVGPVPNNSVRRQFDCSRYPIDFQILGSNRLLVAEYLDRRVTERNAKGEVLWQHHINTPIACQRLPNGHTFIASRQQLLIVDRGGKEIFSHLHPNVSISAAQRLRNGQIVIATSAGRCALLDSKGTEIKGFQMGGNVYTLGGNIEVLSSGRILVPLYTQNCLVEFDWNGNRLWQAKLNRPTAVARLQSGNTLVTCTFDSRIVEINSSGKEVWSLQTDGRPFRARRR